MGRFFLQDEKLQYPNRWTSPEVGALKLNVDASVFTDADSFSVGRVLRDHHGTFIHGRTMKFAGKVDVLEAELVGILEALIWTSAFSGYMIIIESDSLLSVKAIQGNNQNQLEAGMLVDQCRDILRTRELVSLGFVKKHANRVASELARLPCTLNSFIIVSSTLCVGDTYVGCLKFIFKNKKQKQFCYSSLQVDEVKSCLFIYAHFIIWR